MVRCMVVMLSPRFFLTLESEVLRFYFIRTAQILNKIYGLHMPAYDPQSLKAP
jgi:hypothetical protein